MSKSKTLHPVYDLRSAFERVPVRAAPAPPVRQLADLELVGVGEVARMTGMSKRWVYESFSNPYRGGIRPIKLGHVSKWYRWEVLAWIAKQHEASR